MTSLFDKLVDAAKNAVAMRTQAESGFPEQSRSFVFGESPSEMAFNAAMLPVGAVPRMAALGASALGYSPDAEASKLALLKRLEKTGVVDWFNEAMKAAKAMTQKDPYDRMKAVTVDMPHLAEVYSPEAMARAVVRSEPNQLVQMAPSEFLKLAEPFPMEQSRAYLDHYKDLLRKGEWVEPEAGLFNEWYLKKNREVPFKGFDEVPWLIAKPTYADQPSLSSRIIGHEGRHRSQALSEIYGADAPFLTNIRGDYAKGRLYNIYPQVGLEEDLMFKRPLDLSGNRRYAEGGKVKSSRIPKTNTRFIDPEAETFRGIGALEMLRGYAGAPSQASVMRPGGKEAYESGENIGAISALADLIPGIGAAKAGAYALPVLGGMIRRGGNPELLAVHNMGGGDPLHVLTRRRSISSPSVAISKQMYPFATTPTILFNPDSPLLDPKYNPANQLFNRDAYTHREYFAPRQFRIGSEDVRMSENVAPEGGHRISIQLSPRFNFAEYEKSPFGSSILTDKFDIEETDFSNQLVEARNKWIEKNLDKFADIPYSQRDPNRLLRIAAKQGDLDAASILTMGKSVPSTYGELKVAGEIPITPRDVQAIIYPNHYAFKRDEFDDIIKRIEDTTGVPAGTADMLIPEKMRPFYESGIESAANILKNKGMLMQESGPVEYHQILDELSSGPVGKYLDKSDIWQFSNPSSYGNLNKAVANRIYSSPRFAAEIGQILTAR